MFKAEKFKGKTACVLGLGKTGMAVVNLLHKNKFKVFISDSSLTVPKVPRGVSVELGVHTERVLDCGFIVKSPGIFPNHPILKAARAAKIPIFSEVEVAFSFIPKEAVVFAVTGTNGKTTATMLLSEILKQHVRDEKSKNKVYTLGNIGVPASEMAGKIKKGDYVVIEMSSYQLEDSVYFAPKAACVLNITEDHLEHHGSLKKYIEAKKKIFKFQTARDFAVINAADGHCREMLRGVKAKIFSFATTPLKEIRSHVFYDGDEMVFSSGVRLRPPSLPGLHNVENAMAASLMALACGVSPDSVQRAFNKFRGAEHRIETFFTHKGITCINDSKSTNVDSAVTALKAVGSDKKIWLILGGRDKGAPYSPLLPYLRKYCKKVLTIGEAMSKIKKDLKGFPVQECVTLENAVSYADKHASAGDILLLSPACASFDQFKNFEERGKAFKKICRSLARKI